jgi:hypothetical protein
LLDPALVNSCRSIALLIVLFVADTAWSYQLKRDSTGAVVRWSRLPQFLVDERVPALIGDPSALTAVEQAVLSASDAAPGLTLSLVTGTPEGVGYDFSSGSNANEIVLPDHWDYDEDAIAVTVTTIDSRRHEIVDADIVLNIVNRRFKVLAADSRPGGEYDDLQNALTHELGHAIGLGHSPEQPLAVMYPVARRGEVTKRTFSSDDLEGLAELYPGSNPVGVNGALPFSDVFVGCSAGGNRASLWLLLSLVPIFLRQSLHRRRVLSSAATALLLVSAPSLAADHRRGDAPVEDADWVGTGQVRSARTLPPQAGEGLLFTELEVTVHTCHKGTCPQSVTVRVPGGRHGDFEQLIDGQPAPKGGESVGLTRGKRKGQSKPKVGVYDLGRMRDFDAFGRGLQKLPAR